MSMMDMCIAPLEQNATFWVAPQLVAWDGLWMTDNLPVALALRVMCQTHDGLDPSCATAPRRNTRWLSHGRRTAQTCCKSERRLHEQELCATQSGISATAAPKGATCTSQRALLKADHHAVDFLVFGGLSPHPVACS